MSTQEAVDLDLAAFDKLDEAEMNVELNGKPTGWVWTFAGPGHQQTIAQSNRLARERLQQDRLKEQARVNGRKWSAPEETVEDVRNRNVSWVVDRLLGWSPVKIAGEDLPFSAEAARKLLADPRKVELLAQCMTFLADDDSFTRRSPKV